MKTLRIHLLAAVALGLAVPACAGASTARMETAPETPYLGYGFYSGIESAHYIADPGERNQLLVSYDGDALGVTLTDPGAVITPGESCSSVDAHSVHCVPRPYPVSQQTYLQHVEVDLGDGDDEVHTTRPTPYPIGGVSVRGGPGDDLLDGGAGGDELDGGGGKDTLLGGAETDVLNDGDRTGAAGDAGPGADTMDGGDGTDLVAYRGRTGGVKVNLASGSPAGEPGENDVVRGVEDVEGGDGPDRLTGDEGPNSLTGGDGDDVLSALDGDDSLRGGAGGDRIVGAGGSDLIVGATGIDSYSCGAGADTLVDPEPGEPLESRCDEVSWVAAFGDDGALFRFAPHPAARSRRALSFRIGCPEYEARDGEFSPCSGSLKLREASGKRRLLGQGRFSVPVFSHPPKGVRVVLTRLGRRLARRRSGVLTTASLGGEHLPRVDWTIRVKVPR
jgi:Ca2+-binding RTX toxin-like protein